MTNRNYSLDVIRTFAILFVVANHAIELIFPFDYKANGVVQFCCMSYPYQLFQFIVFTLGRLGVPLFFMLTGYLLVSKNYKTKDKILKFYKRNFIGLLTVWYIWIFLYNIFFHTFQHQQFVIKDVLLELIFFKNVPLAHTWYMKEIIIIYAMLPLLSNVLKRIKHIFIVILAILIISITNDLFSGIRYLNFLSNKFMYIAYVCAGYYFAISRPNLNKFGCISIFALGFSTIAIWQIYTYHCSDPTNVWYTNPFLYLTSFSLFSLLLTYKWEKGLFAHLIDYLSKISFGIYLIHLLIMIIIASTFPSINNISISNVLLLYVFSIITCAIIIYPFTKAPKVAKTLFYIK